MATAAFMFLIHNFRVSESEIEVLDLKLNFDREVVVGFASLFLVYFTYVLLVCFRVLPSLPDVKRY